MTLRLGTAALGFRAAHEITFAPWGYGLFKHHVSVPYRAPTFLTLIFASAGNYGSRRVSRDHLSRRDAFQFSCAVGEMKLGRTQENE
jgi:hypothetical protein